MSTPETTQAETKPTEAPKPSAPVASVDIPDGGIAIVFITAEEGLGASVHHNITNDNPNILVPLIRGVLATLHEEGGADRLIQKGVQSITANATVN